MKQVNLRLSEELYDRVEQARGSVPRERWLRTAVEQALEMDTHTGSSTPTPASPAGAAPRGARRSRVPAESLSQPGPDVTRVRSSGQSKRDVQPIAKK